MIPVKQTRFDENGNCMEACLASLLHLKINEVPDLHAYEKDGEWLIKLNKWLNGRGLIYIEVLVPEQERESFFQNRDFYYILIGKTRKNIGLEHAVIGRKGKIVHDPFKRMSVILESKFLKLGLIVSQCK